MPTETTFVPLSSNVRDGQTAQWPRVGYQRLATELDLIVDSRGQVPNLAGGLQVQLTLDPGTGAVAQAGTYTLPQGLKVGENIIGGGLIIPANVFPGVIVTANGGAGEVQCWLTSDVTTAADQTGTWVVLTAADLQSRIDAPTYNAFTATILMNGQADPVPQILQSITDKVRGYVMGNPNNVLGLEGSIPKQLVDVALTLAKERLFSRVSALRRFIDAMKDELARASNDLKDVAAGKFRISQPVTVAVEQPQGGGSVEGVPNHRRSRFERGDLHGL